MTDADLARIHAAAMRDSRPWSAAEIGTTRTSRGAVESTLRGGFALGRVTLDEAELLTIAVAPARQGSGIGARLLRDLHAAAIRAGAAVIHLEVAAQNGAARRLYKRAGYVEMGIRRGYYGGASDAVTMRCDLR